MRYRITEIKIEIKYILFIFNIVYDVLAIINNKTDL